ncbi:MAG: shikimate dehydrogenase [Bacteroidales bacterium]|nr:shikimate dehydrogenase [Bacteroidales bacterium]
MDQFQNDKKQYGLIGYPLGHSFSMEYFNEKFESEKINAEYLNFEIEDIGQVMEVIAEYPDLRGLNVTIPYKEQVLPYLTSIDDGAKAIGAVNVIKITRGKKDNEIELRGYNSDAIGFMKSVEPYINEHRRKAMVLGTGGAAKAVTYALNKLGVEVMHVSRRKSAATHTYDELTKAMVAEHKIIVNTTPLGMFPNVDQCPDFPYRFLTKGHLCYDVVYNPDVTLFMKKSQEAGAEVKNGLEMLLLQAFAAYDIWTK